MGIPTHTCRRTGTAQISEKLDTGIDSYHRATVTTGDSNIGISFFFVKDDKMTMYDIL